MLWWMAWRGVQVVGMLRVGIGGVRGDSAVRSRARGRMTRGVGGAYGVGEAGCGGCCGWYVRGRLAVAVAVVMGIALAERGWRVGVALGWVGGERNSVHVFGFLDVSWELL